MDKNVHRRVAAAASPGGRKPPVSSWRPLSDNGALFGPAGQRKYLNADERRRFIAAATLAPAEVKTLCLTLIHTGCRISEALSLTAGDIEFADGLIAVRSLKKRGRMVIRQIPMPPALLQEVVRVHGLAAGAPPSADIRLWPWGRTRAWQLIKEVMATARIAQLPASPKGLRHAFGVHAILSGVPLHLVQKWLGHENIATTAIYTNVLGPEERAIAKRMW